MIGFWGNIILLTLCILSILWGGLFFFKRQTLMLPVGMTIIGCSSGLYFLILIYYSFILPVSYLSALFSSLFYLLSFLLFWWAIFSFHKKKNPTVAFSSDTPIFINRDGPYNLVRHPFYTSYLMLYWGAFIRTLSLSIDYIFGSLLVFIYFYMSYFIAAKKEETKFMNSSLKSQYEQYKNEVGFFFPYFLK